MSIALNQNQNRVRAGYHWYIQDGRAADPAVSARKGNIEHKTKLIQIHAYRFHVDIQRSLFRDAKMSWCNVVVVMKIHSHEELPEPCSHRVDLSRSYKCQSQTPWNRRKKKNDHQYAMVRLEGHCKHPQHPPRSHHPGLRQVSEEP